MAFKIKEKELALQMSSLDTANCESRCKINELNSLNKDLIITISSLEKEISAQSEHAKALKRDIDDLGDLNRDMITSMKVFEQEKKATVSKSMT